MADNGRERSGTTFFFPFVITFAILFSMLLAGIIRARRRARYLRVLAEQRGVNIGRGYGLGLGWWGEPWLPNGSEQEEVETPVFKEHQVVKGDLGRARRWEEMMPLSVLREMPPPPPPDIPSASRLESQAQQPVRRRDHPWLKPFAFITKRNNTAPTPPTATQAQAQAPTPTPAPVVDATFQICVLINMPSQSSTDYDPAESSYFEANETVFGTHTTVKSGWPQLTTESAHVPA